MAATSSTSTKTTTDTTTLKNIDGKQRDSILMITKEKEPTGPPKFEPVGESSLLSRLRTFMPQMAAANETLSSENIPVIDMEVKRVVAKECDSSSEDDSDSDSEEESEKKAEIEIDLSLFRSEGTTSTNDVEAAIVDQVPEGFLEKEGAEIKESPKKTLIEEL